MKTAKELGFIPQTQPMSEEQTKNFAMILLADKDPEIPEKDLPFTIQILNKRIEVLDLPIEFSLKAKFLLWILTKQNPGKMIVALIDCLTKFENQTVTDQEICGLYPMGFYTDESTMDYIDNYIKPKKIKWSEIY